MPSRSDPSPSGTLRRAHLLRAAASAAHAQAPTAVSLQDCICRLYEHSFVPVREIARLAGLTERNVYATVRRRGCRPRMRVGPGGGRRIVLPGDNDPPAELDADAMQRALAACAEARQRLHQVAAEKLAARQRGATTRQSKRAIEADARTLAILAGTMRDLVKLAEAVEPPHARAREPDPAHRRPERPISPAASQRRAAPPAAAWPSPPAAAPPSEADRRIDAVAERFYAKRKDRR